MFFLWLANHLDGYQGDRAFLAHQLDQADEARALLPPDELERMTKVAHPDNELLEAIRTLSDHIDQIGTRG